jgi:hypothetical protein
MNNSFHNVSATQLRHAADVKEKIDALQNQLEQLLGATSQPRPKPAAPKKRRMSAAARARIAAGARARWARIKGTMVSSKPATQPKRKMSAAAKARLSAIARARWKKAKAAGQKAL